MTILFYFLLTLVAIFFLYWMVREGENVKKQQQQDRWDSLEDQYP